MTNCLPINNNISVDSYKYNFNLKIQDNYYGLYPTISDIIFIIFLKIIQLVFMINYNSN